MTRRSGATARRRRARGDFHDSPGVPPPRAGKDRRDSFVVTVGPDGRTRAGRVRAAGELPRAPARNDPARPRGRRRPAPRRAHARPAHRRITGAGKSHYGDYDVTGTLARAPGDTHAKLRLTKFKKPKPWYYDPCVVCGEEGDTATLLLCDGQDKHCKNAAHLACVGLDAVPDGEWFCPDCAKPQCAASCVCRRRL